MLDADCRIDQDSLRRIADLAHHTGRPVQAEDLMEPPNRSLIARTSAFAFTVKNRVRTRGLHRLGIPVPLAGTGMAFPFALLRSAPRMRGHLAEDRLLGLELTLGGRPPFYAGDASVRSLLPSTRAAARRQRGRWESGSLALLGSHGARVVREALRHRRPQLLGLALDLAIPPLSLLVLFAVLSLGLVSAAVALGASGALVFAGAAPIAFVAVGVLSAWAAEGRELLGAGHLVLVPFYVIWKIPLYLGMAVRSVPLRWERTARERIE